MPALLKSKELGYCCRMVVCTGQPSLQILFLTILAFLSIIYHVIKIGKKGADSLWCHFPVWGWDRSHYFNTSEDMHEVSAGRIERELLQSSAVNRGLSARPKLAWVEVDSNSFQCSFLSSICVSKKDGGITSYCEWGLKKSEYFSSAVFKRNRCSDFCLSMYGPEFYLNMLIILPICSPTLIICKLFYLSLLQTLPFV